MTVKELMETLTLFPEHYEIVITVEMKVHNINRHPIEFVGVCATDEQVQLVISE